MYLSHYGLQKKPFDISPDPSFLWLGEKHREALSYLKYGILENKGFLMITGDVGTGKTALIKRLTKLIDAATFVITVPDPDMDKIDFFNFLADELHMDRTFSTKGEFLIHFKHFLQDAYSVQRKVLLIIDESQRLNHDLLQEIRLLSNIDLGGKVLLNIFFVGQTEFNDMLREERNRTVRQRISASFHLEPLSADEVASYISHRLRIAGASNQIFTAEAIKRVYEYTSGYPRLINILCDHALMTGYATGANAIVPSIIDECSQELTITFGRSIRNPRPGPVPVTDSRPEPSAQLEPLLSEEPELEPAVAPITSEAVVKQMALTAAEGNKSIIKPLALAAAVLIMLGGIAYFSYGPVRNYVAGQSRTDMTVPPLAGLPQKGSTAVAATNSFGQTGQESAAVDAAGQSTTEVPTAYSTGSGTGGASAAAVEPSNEIKAASPDMAASGSPGGEANNAADRQAPSSTESAGAAEAAQSDESPTVASLAGSDGQASPLPSKLIDQAAAETGMVQRAMIYFKTDSNKLPPDALTLLEKLADVAYRMPKAQISIEGYTDALGNEWYNRKLSQSRADIVRDFFLERGIHPAKIRAVGLGAQNPIAGNETSEGRQRNRRVEVLIGTAIN